MDSLSKNGANKQRIAAATMEDVDRRVFHAFRIDRCDRQVSQGDRAHPATSAADRQRHQARSLGERPVRAHGIDFAQWLVRLRRSIASASINHKFMKETGTYEADIGAHVVDVRKDDRDS
jgi:hypothetical protein